MPAEASVFGPVIATIELVGALLIAGYAAAALAGLPVHRSIERARLLVIEGALAGLGFKLAATLLKTVQLASWRQIGAFAAILALRTLLKQLLNWEGRRIAASPRLAG